MMEELIENIKGLRLKYKIKKQKYDFSHLIVVFSGYGESDEFAYNMENVLQHCPANVLWIKDEFYGRCSYYMCHDRDFSISIAVNDFIERKLNELFIQKDNCTLIGFSKGGTAALYFGLKFGYENILLSAPQFKLGRFCEKSRPLTLKHMAGDKFDSVQFLDGIIYSALVGDKCVNKNIYLIISPMDPDYDEQIEFSNYLKKYKNFNLIISKSEFVRSHAMVTMHNVPLILSIVYALSSGVAPRYGNIELKPSIVQNKSVKKEVVVQLRKARLEGSLLYPEGVGIVRGYNCESYGDINYKLLLKSTNNEYIYALAKSHKPILTREFYADSFFIYDKCWFCSSSFAGIDVSNLPAGVFEMFIIIDTREGSFKEKIASKNIINSTSESNDFKYMIYSDCSGSFVKKIGNR